MANGHTELTEQHQFLTTPRSSQSSNSSWSSQSSNDTDPPIADTVRNIIIAAVPEYTLAIAIIYLGYLGTIRTLYTFVAWVSIAGFLALTYHLQFSTIKLWRSWGATGESQYEITPENVSRTFNVSLQQTATVCTKEVRFTIGKTDAKITKECFSQVSGVPTTLQTLLTALVVGQSFGEHLDTDAWRQGWNMMPFIASYGFPLTFLSVKLMFWILSVHALVAYSIHALQTKRLKALAHLADVTNLVVLSDVLHLLAEEHDDRSIRVMANERRARFKTKVCVVCVHLWLKVSLLGLALDLTTFEIANLSVSIMASYYTILGALQGQCQTVLRHWSRGVWAFDCILPFAFACAMCAACAVRLVGAAVCTNHYFNIIGFQCVPLGNAA